ncbi:cell division control protein Cdc6 [Candidatus Pacearchaeota archaeon CG_4_9_14_3_um_filter_31_7]|nr:MAG: cell division control protein Cdc6 [Candidatus Pacearchaeota archaeon CG10_big_fil_rev_8_21_14_0_10_31_59]PIZ81045.1 MAG: cell division control protein Cdc6 [Candidatus Pacearchaeota archaeon CG_4_10_14_0_2_um_filter_31_10]PJA70812.1 MAG: cell division control protein Cdc6 [Candidatus Pacearchaeota archaeon CG_4_9_14_3_um_filter_31_7]
MGIKLDNIFDAFSKNFIFRNKNILQSNYTPETILHRDEQIKQVASILRPALRLEKPSNLFLYGLTGTGKTLVVQYVRNQLLERAEKQKLNLKIEYINCKLKKVGDTEYRILAELLRKFGEDIPFTGLPTGQLYQKFTELIENKTQLFIIILDEIDQAVRRIGDGFLYTLTRINSELKNSQISLIGISNDTKFIDQLDPRIKSSLSEEELIFPPYNALQLKDVLASRSKTAFKEGVIGEGVINKCAAYAALSHGDARRALDLLRVSGELAERRGAKEVTEKDLDEAKEKIEKDRILDLIKTQPKQFHFVLYSILLLEENKKNKIFTGDIYRTYEKLCKNMVIECLTQRRVGDIIAEFDMVGIVNAKVISKGRGGRTREIKLAIPETLIPKVKEILEQSLNI